MGKNRSASGLTNVIQYDNNGNIAFVSGSTTLMQVSSSGAITTTGVISGSNALSASFSLNSALLNDTGSVGFATTSSLLTVSSSQQQISASLLQVSASYISLSGSYNVFSGSNSTILTAVSSSQQQISASLLNVISIFATTGSNTFTGPQFASNTSNAISFTSTASLYSDGGLRVQGNSFVSGTAYFNNIVVYGTSSIQYITSSQVNVGTNIITVNTDTPAVRFGGLAVFDSGSTQLTGSILWDSEKNHWVYSNPSGSTYSGGMFISGPRSSALGSEQGTTACMLLVGQGSDHLTSSMIYHSSICTNFYSNALFVSSSGNVGIGTNAPTRLLDVSNTSGDSTIVITSADATGQSSLFYGKPSDANIGGVLYNHCNNQMSFRVNDTTKMSIASTGDVGIGTCTPSYKLDVRNASGTGAQTIVSVVNKTNDSNTGAFIGFGDAYTDTVSPYLFAARVGGTRDGSGDGGFMSFYTRPTSAFEYERMRITAGGIACFACQVCAPTFKGGSFNGTTGYFSCHIELNDNGSGWIYAVDKNHSIILRGDRTGCVADYTNYYQYGGNLSTGKGHNFWTDGVLASQTIKMQIANNGICMTVPLYVCNSTNSRSFQTIAGGNIIGPYGTCTLLYLSTALAGTYIINASFGPQGLDIYGGMLIVVANGGSFRTITNGSGTRSNITLSGCAVQLTNALGVTLEASAQALFVGGL